MSIRSALSIGLATGILAAVSLQSVSAATFAQFRQAVPGNLFSLTGMFPPGQSLVGSAVPIVFTFGNVAGNPPITNAALYGQDITGSLTLMGMSNSPASAGMTPQETFGSVTFSFIADAQTVNGVSIAAGSKLLSGVSTPTPASGAAGVLSGTISSGPPPQPGSATLSGSDNSGPGGIGNVVTFQSDFLNFSGATGKGYGFSFSNVTPDFGVSGSVPFTFITPFTAAGTGTFAATGGVVPEPGTISLLAGLGVTGSLIAFRRLRRRA